MDTSRAALFTGKKMVALSGLVLAAFTWIFVSCSKNSPTNGGTQMGAAVLSISDPPSCAVPNGSFKSVFVTIRSVQANLSATADDNSSGWQELAPQLNSQPMQVDLLNLPQNGTCLLQQLGSTTSLPVGDYQQIRLLLVANSASATATLTTNACASLGHVYNCVVDSKNNISTLQLSSQANTGLKIPPGQIVDGPIHVSAGQSVDINVDFNACASIVEEGNGQFRLKPTLTAGQISPNTSGISGQVVDSATATPISGAKVALEQADSTGLEHIFMEASADANGNFRFCPLPTGSMFDVVVDAVNAAGVGYNATVLLHVPAGTAIGTLPIVAEPGTPPGGPGILQGIVTAVNGTTGANVDVSLAALEPISVSGGGNIQIVAPLLSTSQQSSSDTVAVQSATPCQGNTPAGAFCAQYTMVVPASNPSVGAFVSGTTTKFAAPATGDALYSVQAQASQPMSGGIAMCSPAIHTTALDNTGQPLKVTAGATSSVHEIDFSGCQ
jgi:Domain of unknown function (DUF4382)